MLRNRIAILTLAALLGPASQVAQAATFNISDVSGEWIDIELSNGNGFDDPTVSTTTADDGEERVLWGNAASSTGRSGYGFRGIGELEVDTGEIFQFGRFSHFNRPIFLPIATEVDLEVSIDFSLPDLTESFEFVFDHFETPNSTTPCPAGDSAPCADIVTVPTLNAANTFEYQGQTYILEFVGFSEVSVPIVKDVSEISLSTQFVSDENADNTAYLYGQIKAVESVPEPMTILGSAVALGLFAQRKRFRQKLSQRS